MRLSVVEHLDGMEEEFSSSPAAAAAEPGASSPLSFGRARSTVQTCCGLGADQRLPAPAVARRRATAAAHHDLVVRRLGEGHDSFVHRLLPDVAERDLKIVKLVVRGVSAGLGLKASPWSCA